MKKGINVLQILFLYIFVSLNLAPSIAKTQDKLVISE